MRDLGYFNVWENCFHSLFGKKSALRYAEPTYCKNGLRYFTANDKLDERHDLCPDWPKCKGLNKSLHM